MPNQTTTELGQLVKSKYPGKYDSLKDDEVGRLVKAKFPGAYSQFTDEPVAPLKEEGTGLRGKIDQFLEPKDAPFESQATDTAGQSMLKTVGNIPNSAANFAKGAVTQFRPDKNVQMVRDAATEFSTDKNVGESNYMAPSAWDVAKELPMAALKTLVPQSIQELGGGIVKSVKERSMQGIDVGLSQAKKTLVEDSFGQAAIPVLTALGIEEVVTKPTRIKAAATPDFLNPRETLVTPKTPVSDAIGATGKVVTKPAAAVGKGVVKGVSELAKYGITHLSGLDAATIDAAVKGAGRLTDAVKRGVNRQTTSEKVAAVLEEKIQSLSDTGKEYQGLRKSTQKMGVPANLFHSVLNEFGITMKNGKVQVTAESVPLSKGDIAAIEQFYKQYGKTKTLSANAFLNLRKALDHMSSWDAAKTDFSDAIARKLRKEFNAWGHRQLEGLEAMDAKYSPAVEELKGYRKEFLNRDGTLKDSAINRIANATGKGKDALLGRLEELVPGITEDIRLVKAIEDLEAASGHKVGTYVRAAVGAGVGFGKAGPVGAIIGAVATNPKVVVSALETGAKAAKGAKAAGKAVKGAVDAGVKGAGKLLSTPIDEIPVRGLSTEDVGLGRPGYRGDLSDESKMTNPSMRPVEERGMLNDEIMGESSYKGTINEESVGQNPSMRPESERGTLHDEIMGEEPVRTPKTPMEARQSSKYTPPMAAKTGDKPFSAMTSEQLVAKRAAEIRAAAKANPSKAAELLKDAKRRMQPEDFAALLEDVRADLGKKTTDKLGTAKESPAAKKPTAMSPKELYDKNLADVKLALEKDPMGVPDILKRAKQRMEIEEFKKLAREVLPQLDEYTKKELKLTKENLQSRITQDFTKGVSTEKVKDHSEVTRMNAKDHGLSQENLDLQEKSIKYAVEHEDRLLSEIMARKGDKAKTVNADDFRPFFKEIGYNGMNSAGVQEASSYLSKRLQTELLRKEGGSLGVGTAGGSGAGKGTALKKISEYTNAVKEAAMINDSNASNLASTVKKIQEVVNSGRDYIHHYVYRDILDAYVNGVVKRMIENPEEMGRIVPNRVTAENHIGSWNVAKHLEDYYGIDVRWIDNSLGRDASSKVTRESLEAKIKYPSKEKLKAQLDAKAKELLKEGDITKEQYDKFIE